MNAESGGRFPAHSPCWTTFSIFFWPSILSAFFGEFVRNIAFSTATALVASFFDGNYADQPNNFQQQIRNLPCETTMKKVAKPGHLLS
jgi:hypothetical protein